MKHLDFLLGEALETLAMASQQALTALPTMHNSFRLKIGRIIALLWELRTILYEMDPSLKRDFVVEYEDNMIRYEELATILSTALRHESACNFYLANMEFKNLLSKAHHGYFRLVAEAGLYRTTFTLGYSNNSCVSK